ncbi:chitin deacetylase 8 [Amyelois transitella]|uniref:chitin deacetylase 8 n=1 Tax=Amyelois transitella TaxID=680683 RepID=UPI00067BB15C|nr:chitin deacetylase 8 [Amyelois transitella]
MKLIIGVVFIVVSALADELPLAEQCDEEACQLPDCRCSSTDIPGGLRPRDTPQFVTITFDGGLNTVNIQTYRQELYDKTTKNGCPIGATFYVNHEYTNYNIVNELYNRGFEIGLNSISHRTPPSYWAQADYDTVMAEIGDQRIQMAHFANIPMDAIKGVRLPFLQMTGNSSFQVMADIGLLYDASWSTTANTNPGLWPYTLDYASTQDCNIPPCPTASIPGAWVFPLVAWLDLSGTACTTVDSCFDVPEENDVDGWYRFYISNFERHYLGSRAPFGFHVKEAYFTIYPGARVAFRRFLELLNNLHDVFVVNSSQVIEWIKDPVPVSEYIEQPCWNFVNTRCNHIGCPPLTSEHNQIQYWMEICNICPRVYPWVGNPLGL